MALEFVAPSGESVSLDTSSFGDADSFSSAMSALMPHSVPAGARVVGFMDEDGHVMLPTLVLRQPDKFVGQRISIILDPKSVSGTQQAPSGSAARRGNSESSAAGARGESKRREESKDASEAASTGSPHFLLQFAMYPGDKVGLSFTHGAVRDLHRLVRLTGLSTMPFTKVADAFASEADSGILRKAGFDRAIRNLVPRESLGSKEERRNLSVILNGIFFLFDRKFDWSVVLSEFVAGFSVFCDGNKSDKLAEAFQIFDLDGDGQCSRREMWRFLRSFLTALFGVSSSRLPGDGGSLRRGLHDLIDDTAVEATHLVFSSSGDPKRVSFDMFGEWYNTGGYKLLPWLELLDLGKWPSEDAAASGASTSAAPTPAAPTPAPTTAPTTAPTAQPFLSFTLSGDCPNLELTSQDVQRFHDLLAESGLGSVRPKVLAKALVRSEKDGMLGQSAFMEVMKGFIPGDVLRSSFSPLSDHTVSSALTAIFGAFDLYGGEVDTNEFVSGFLLLASGSKSDKLSLAFNLFDTDNDGFLKRRSVWKFLRSFLTALACLSSQCAIMQQDSVQQMVDAGAVDITAHVFLVSERDHEDRISFDAFGTWYNQGGYKRAPWLELLDHSKWLVVHPDSVVAASQEDQQASAAAAAAASAAQQQQHQQQAAAAQAAAQQQQQPSTFSSGSSTVLLEFVLSSAGEKLQLTAADCAKMAQIQALTGLASVDPEYMHTLFNTMTRHGYLDKRGFDHCVRELVPGDDLSDDDKTFLTYVLSLLFYAFVYRDEDEVPYEEFSAGMSLLADGSKSDKLSLAFRLFDDDEDGYLDRKQLFGFLRGFLTALVSMQGAYLGMDKTGVRTVVNGAAVEATNTIFQQAQLSKDHVISYEEFGTWYNDGGYLVVPWLELLDLKKWPTPDDAPAPAPATATAAPPAPSAAAPPAAPTAATTADADSAMFQFKLFGGSSLTVSQADCANLKRFLALTQLNAKSPEALLSAFSGAESQSASTDSQSAVFQSAIRALIQPERLSSVDEHTFVADRLATFYGAFVHLESVAPDLTEMVVGMLVFASGSKSDKLALAFRLFDDDDDGLLSKLQLWRYIRSFLVALVALTAPVVSSVVDRAAVELTQVIFNEAEVSASHEGSISHAEFGQWYNSGGFEVMPWLELLDLSKWPVPADASATTTAPSAPSAPTTTTATSSSADDTVFDFMLSEHSEQALVITSADCDRVHRLVAAGGFASIQPAELAAALKTAADAETDGDGLTKAGFAAAMNALVSATEPEELTFLTNGLVTIYDRFLTLAGNTVNPTEFAVGLSLLAAGGKSDKLSLAFHLLDTTKAGSLTKVELFCHFRALLSVLVSVAGTLVNAPDDGQSVETVLYRAAMDSVLSVFASANPADPNRITYDEFGHWYNAGGFHSLPWLELLDIRKWPKSQQSASAPASASASAAAPPTTSSVPSQSAAVFEFTIGAGDDGTTITISAGDIANLHRVLDVSRFGRLEADHLLALFDSEAVNGTLTKQAFDRCMRRLVPVQSMSDGDMAFLSHVLLSIFTAFDRNGDGVVDEAEFAAGFSMLASGSKSDKLSLAFRLFDEDGDGYVSPTEMRRYLTGFITVLVALSNTDGSRADLDAVVTQGAAQLTADIFATADTNQDGRISYEEFGEWYNSGGHQVVPWLELLDVRKWPSDAAGSSGSGSGAAAGSSAVAAAGSAPTTEHAGPTSQADLISISASDVANLRRLMQTSGLDSVLPSRATKLFEAHQESDGCLTKAGFDLVMRELIPGSGLSADDKHFLSFALSNVFFAFDRNGDGVVDVDEFSAGFSLLTSGSKSDKLSIAFRLFDEDGDGYISRSELYRYLCAFLTVLCALQRCYTGTVSSELHAVIRSSALEMTQVILAHADANKDGRISYEEFGQWYNEGGFEIVPWLELLDLKKWPAAAGAGAGAGAGGDASGAADASADASAAASDDDKVFEFELNDGGKTLVIRQDDANNLSRIVSMSGLAGMDPEYLQQVFNSKASEGCLTKDGFDAVIRELVPSSSLTPSDRRFLSFALSNIFFAFDRDDNGVVDFNEFVSGFTLLTSGSKSDKLSLAFRMFDEDGDGYVSRTEMWRYLRAFLTILAALPTDAKGSSAAGAMEDELGRAAVDLTSLIFREADTNSDGRISYDEFGKWYNGGGFEVIPWLELLDLRKWPQDDEEYDGDDGEEEEEDDDESDQEDNDDDEDGEEAEDGDGAGAGAGSRHPPTAVFKFSLPPHPHSSLVLTYEDCSNMQRGLIKSQLDAVSPDAIVSTVKDVCKGSSTATAADLASILSTVSANASTTGAWLTSAFSLYDRRGVGSVDANQLCCGLVMLGSGSKSEKLSVAFRLFDADGDDKLSGRELTSFLRGFLIMLASFSGSMLSGGTGASDQVQAVLDAALNVVVASALESSSSGDGGITYAEFGSWYNRDGHKLVPWIELLDTRKWPDVLADGVEDEDTSDEDYTTGDAEDDEEDDEDDDGDDAGNVEREGKAKHQDAEAAAAAGGGDADDDDSSEGVFVFHLSDSKPPIHFTYSVIATVLRVVSLSQLSTKSAEDVSAALAPNGPGSPPLTKRTFTKAMRSLIPGKSLSVDDQRFLTRHLVTLYKAFAGSGTEADACCLSAGFSLLVSGTKSEKLSHAFSLLDSDKDGALSQSQLATFIRTFLTALVAVARSDDGAGDGAGAGIGDMAGVVSDAAANVAKAVMTDCGRDGTITYPDFGTWYNNGGFEAVPWLELLDLGKWPTPPEKASS